MGRNRTSLYEEEHIIRSLADGDLRCWKWLELRHLLTDDMLVSVALRTLNYQALYVAYIICMMSLLGRRVYVVLLYPHWMVGGENTCSSRLSGARGSRRLTVMQIIL